jgi:light-independent protochlorophyllide reductase subunit B
VANGAHSVTPTLATSTASAASVLVASTAVENGAKQGQWTAEAEKELKKIPFFVRGKARRNTEAFALERGLESITLETLYDAKAHFRS